MNMDKLISMSEEEYRTYLSQCRQTGDPTNGPTSMMTMTRIPAEPWLKIFAPPQYQSVGLATFEVTNGNRRMYNTVKQWVGRFSQDTTTGLLLHGTTGVGKTHLAYSIGDALSKKGQWPYFTNWVDFLAKIKASWNDERLSETAIKEPLLTKRVVIIDDLGAELIAKNEQNWVTERLYEIINARLDKQLPTIVTSNLNLDALGKRYSERTSSRLADMCRPIWCQTDDYRLQRPAREDSA